MVVQAFKPKNELMFSASVCGAQTEATHLKYSSNRKWQQGRISKRPQKSLLKLHLTEV
jgi:hypothetical protein